MTPSKFLPYLTRFPVYHDRGDPGPGRLDELDVGGPDVGRVRRHLPQIGGKPRARLYLLKMTFIWIICNNDKINSYIFCSIEH